MPTKLHELLAVQGNTSGQASKTRGELKNTFEKKRHLFEGRRKSFTPFGEDDGLTAIEEVQEIQSTVASEIQWVSGYLAKAVDVAYQVDLANTGARADVLLENGSILVKNIPATTLLQLEKRIVEWKELIEAIPTLDPGQGLCGRPGAWCWALQGARGKEDAHQKNQGRAHPGAGYRQASGAGGHD